MKSPRCTATSKRTRKRCMARALRGWSVCYYHGAGGGAPTGERNGSYRHGAFCKSTIAEQKALRDLMSECAGVLKRARSTP
jgi:hypothetical protein